MFVYYPDPSSYVGRQTLSDQRVTDELAPGADVNGWVVTDRRLSSPLALGDFVAVRMPYTGRERVYVWREG